MALSKTGALILGISVSCCLAACTKVEYKLWETIGYEKRQLLQSNVEKAQDDQDEVKEQFAHVIDQIRSEYDFSGGDLEQIYDDLSAQYEKAKEKSTDLQERVGKVERIAADLFAEWKDELAEISDPKLRADSAQKRLQTIKKFKVMSKAMKDVIVAIDPILVKLNDRVLWLKHNLNAMALKSFRTEFQDIEREVDQLRRQMQEAATKAEQFMVNINSA